MHVAAALDLYTRLLAGDSSPAATIADVPDMNQRAVDAVAERDPRVLAGRIETAAAAYLAAARDRTGDPPVT